MACTDYELIERLIRSLPSQGRHRPPLPAMANKVGLPPVVLNQVVERWAGVSYGQLIDALCFIDAHPPWSSSVTADSSPPSATFRYDCWPHLALDVTILKSGKRTDLDGGVIVHYGYYSTPFGRCLLAHSRHGICFLAFVDPQHQRLAEQRLRHLWPNASLQCDQGSGQQQIDQLFSSTEPKGTSPIRLLLKGTSFQLRVWQALLSVPQGSVVSYKALARAVHRPRAYRAVGTAVGSNPVAFILPCHRVLRIDGGLGGYRWGQTRKRALLACEAIVRSTKSIG